MAGAAATAATVGAGLSAGLPAQLALLTAILASVIIVEQRLDPPGGAGRHTQPGPGEVAGG
jgi:hypothetical protein